MRERSVFLLDLISIRPLITDSVELFIERIEAFALMLRSSYQFESEFKFIHAGHLQIIYKRSSSDSSSRLYTTIENIAATIQIRIAILIPVMFYHLPFEPWTVAHSVTDAFLERTRQTTRDHLG
jgi:hypothetical protein